MKNIKTRTTGPKRGVFTQGQGYASALKNSDFHREHESLKQYGDNPLPPSGGDYAQEQAKVGKRKSKKAA